MRVGDRFICDAYDCTNQSTSKNIIDGQLFTFCNDHAGCLNHSRAEVIIRMIAETSSTKLDIIYSFNYNICGFGKSFVSRTLDELVSSKKTSLKDGCYSIAKDESSCKFPGCRYGRSGEDYCSWHKSMPPVITVNMCYNTITGEPLSISQVSERTGENNAVVESVLKRMAKNGAAKLIRSRPSNKYVVSHDET